MNRQSIINRFIEKTGGLYPIPKYGYIQGKKKGDYGMTTRLDDVMKYTKADTPSTTTVEALLLDNHYELDGWSYDFDESDVLSCARMLQNSPFKNITVIRFGSKLPIAFHRSGYDISILLAPMMFEIKEHISKSNSNPKFGDRRYHLEWLNQLPQSTFWLVKKESGERFVKCYNCGSEFQYPDWVNRAVRDHHPYCMCQCNTYDDFCGCRRIKEMQMYDRLWRQAKVKQFYIQRSRDNQVG